MNRIELQNEQQVDIAPAHRASQKQNDQVDYKALHHVKKKNKWPPFSRTPQVARLIFITPQKQAQTMTPPPPHPPLQVVLGDTE